MARGIRRRGQGGPSLEDQIARESERRPGARTRAEVTPPSGRHPALPTTSATVLAVDLDALVTLASREQLVIALERRVGSFAIAATPLLSWWSATEAVPSEEEERRLDEAALRAVTLGPGPAGDVDSRLRALARDGTLDALASALALLARLPDPPAAFHDAAGFLRVIVPESPFERRLEVLAEVADLARALELLRDCAYTATLPRRRAAIASMAARVLATGGSAPEARREALAEAVDAALEKRWTVL
ncbi:MULTISPECIES: DUF2254 family protein [unclassified Rathayibacter]|uniref:DUF2254 family protein n=1 Tax=unclassified Rathayibacter TaxID=2609250 RepID=UPI00188CD7AA|nr:MULTISPECIES: DUF2254 family protein [unclassified Rathayibacter]MBF4460934.1 DUF2254 domain-containing protein [Rathayibacter sp. VKM Ac-2879]MBF4502345.1 DUF2254 domain-containing protein [Rathayibacter sp. VKM Ac-2878]